MVPDKNSLGAAQVPPIRAVRISPRTRNQTTISIPRMPCILVAYITFNNCFSMILVQWPSRAVSINRQFRPDTTTKRQESHHSCASLSCIFFCHGYEVTKAHQKLLRGVREPHGDETTEGSAKEEDCEALSPECEKGTCTGS